VSEEIRKNTDSARLDQDKAPPPADEDRSGTGKVPHPPRFTVHDLEGADPPTAPVVVFTCLTCGGSGRLESGEECTTCLGMGWVPWGGASPPPPREQREITCPTCDGIGRLESGEECTTCLGMGVIMQVGG
jgi:hypothetical protein